METVSCELCGSDRSLVVLRSRDLLFHLSDDEFTIVRCGACGLLYLNPRPTPEEISQYYPTEYFSPALPKSRTRLEVWLKKLSRTVKRWIREDFYGYPSSARSSPWRHLRKLALWPEKIRRQLTDRDIIPWAGHGRLLDVGCGPGANLQTFQEQGWDVYGIDLSETAVAQAREKVGDRIHCGTLETVPFKDETFDVVVLNHSLEHLFRPIKALEKVWRLLRPGGTAIIAVPNADSLEARLFGSLWIGWDPPRHLCHFGKTTLTKVLEATGFRVSQLRTALGTYFFMVSFERAWTSSHGGKLPARKLLEKVIVTPLCFLAGHLGYGTEIKVYAKKKAGTAAEENFKGREATPTVLT